MEKTDENEKPEDLLIRLRQEADKQERDLRPDVSHLLYESFYEITKLRKSKKDFEKGVEQVKRVMMTLVKFVRRRNLKNELAVIMYSKLKPIFADLNLSQADDLDFNIDIAAEAMVEYLVMSDTLETAVYQLNEAFERKEGGVDD